MRLLLRTILVFLANVSFGQVIEEIKSDNDAISFINKNFPGLHDFQFSKSSNKADSLKNKMWYTVDFDKNGKLDLLISGTKDQVRIMAYVVLANTGDSYSLKDLTPAGYFLTPILRIQKNVDETLVILQQAVLSKQWSDTLIYKFGAFVKYYPSPMERKISLLKYSTTGCHGFCPVYKLTIDSLSNATLEAIAYNETLQGIYHCSLSSQKYYQVTELIN